VNHSDARTRTTTSLLNALNEPGNEEAWRELVDRCTPIMVGVARRMGVRDADLDDVVQTSLLAFLESWRGGQYERSRGRLSAFLVIILRSRVLDLRRRQQAQRERATATLDSDSEIPDPQTMERLWMDERRYQILLTALAQLRGEGVEERTIEAFDLYAVRGVSIAEVAGRLGMSHDEIYGAKYRVSRRLRPIVARIDEMYEDI